MPPCIRNFCVCTVNLCLSIGKFPLCQQTGIVEFFPAVLDFLPCFIQFCLCIIQLALTFRRFLIQLRLCVINFRIGFPGNLVIACLFPFLRNCLEQDFLIVYFGFIGIIKGIQLCRAVCGGINFGKIILCHITRRYIQVIRHGAGTALIAAGTAKNKQRAVYHTGNRQAGIPEGGFLIFLQGFRNVQPVTNFFTGNIQQGLRNHTFICLFCHLTLYQIQLIDGILLRYGQQLDLFIAFAYIHQDIFRIGSGSITNALYL